MRGFSLKLYVVFVLCFSFAVYATFPLPTFAQVTGATMTGTVTDASGAVVPGAQISIKNTETGVTHDIVADSAGLYNAPNLNPGPYEVTVTATGFSTQVRSGLVLTVGAKQELNVTMQVGQVSQRVEVTGEAPAVQTTSSEMSGEVNEKTVVDLPLNGRSWTDMTLLTPGLIPSRRTKVARRAAAVFAVAVRNLSLPVPARSRMFIASTVFTSWINTMPAREVSWALTWALTPSRNLRLLPTTTRPNTAGPPAELLTPSVRLEPTGFMAMRMNLFATAMSTRAVSSIPSPDLRLSAATNSEVRWAARFRRIKHSSSPTLRA